jgi:flavin reductase (DIM6/NTAB) family NADH-FMN oxidoreductase RutF
MKKSLGAKTFLYSSPVVLVGSYDGAGRPNIMTAAWAGICCSRPPCVYVALRKATYTYSSLIERQVYTISVPPVDLLAEADYVGTASGRDEDKFARAGLTPVRSELVDAPYVAECPLVLECRIVHVAELGLHTLFVGEVLDVKADEEVLDERDHLSIERVRPFIYAAPERAYYAVGEFLGKAWEVGKGVESGGHKRRLSSGHR